MSLKGYKILTFLIIININSVYSQIIGNDFGFFIGTSQYNGDVNMDKAFYKPHWTASLWYKQVYNYHYSLRYALSYGELQGSDLDFSNNDYQKSRKYEFSDINLYEFSTVCEFNFFPITPDTDEDNFSPYVVGGASLCFTDGFEAFEILCFPIGAGFKFRLSERVELDLEWVFRKTFSDNIENLETERVGGYNNFKQQSFNETKDWFSLLGATVVISFLNAKSPCPVYREKLNYELIKKRKQR